MAIDLRLPGSSAPVKCTYNLPRKVLEEFELYVEAARETNTDVSPELVLEALILDSTKKDRGFQRWKKERRHKASASGTPESAATP
jgi:hypothetical protein